MKRWGVMVTAAAFVALGACGDAAETPSNSDGSSPAAGGRRWSARSWFDPAYAGSTSKIRVRLDGPTGAGCVEEYEPLVEESGNDVVVSVRFYEPFVPQTCPLSEQSIVVDIGAPLGSRALKALGADTRYRDIEGRLVVVPESTPCGRADCSTISPNPAPCTSDAFDDAIRRNIDEGIGSRDEHCDGSFLIVTLQYDSACLPEQPRDASCARFKKAYFVAKNAAWNIVTYGDDDTCDDVWSRAHIRFPAGLCAESAAATP